MSILATAWVEMNDGQLLCDFIKQRRQEAFAEIVRRHGALVLGVCRSILGNIPDAEDAAQAVFLTLIQKASSLWDRATLAGWLHHVAWYVAVRQQRSSRIRIRHEKQVADMRPEHSSRPGASVPLDQLHAELAGLPEKYRLPLILFHLEGRPQEEIADLLGSNLGVISKRIIRGRQMLHDRLIRVGTVVSVAGLAQVMTSQASGAVSPAFVSSVTKLAAGALTTPAAVGGAASAHIVALSKGALHMLFLAKVKTAALFTTAVFAIVGMIAGTYRVAAAEAAAKPWLPKPPAKDAAVKKYSCPIVRFAGDLSRVDCATSIGTNYRTGRKDITSALKFAQDFDVNENGKTDDDFVGYLEFSLTEALSPPPWPASGILPGVLNSRWFGGMSWYLSDSAPPKMCFSEEHCVNPDHDGPFYDRRAEDFAMMGMSDTSNPKSRFKQSNLILWKKEDFLNGGDKYKVTFAEDSRLSNFLARYWYGQPEGRYVVKDGEQYYISQPWDIPKWFALDKISALTWVDGWSFTMNPTKLLWAKYDPHPPYHLEFDEKEAKFAPHHFSDIQAVGWFITKKALDKSQFHIKWYSFEAEGLIARPDRPSEYIDMVQVPANQGSVPEFYITTCKIPYEFWKQILYYADSPTYAEDPRFVFQKHGDMGSMQFGNLAHGPAEPVTNLTWLDAVTFCNALSQLEGRTPCYYTDPEFKTVFRFQELASLYTAPGGPYKPVVKEEPKPLPKLYVKWAADGYRLPTPAEWAMASADSKEFSWVKNNSNGTTHPVGTKKPNSLGLYDMSGNAWEYVWDGSDMIDARAMDSRLVMGGDFNSPDDPMKISASPYGDTPWEGSWNIGFRMVRREVGLKKPALGAIPDKFGADYTAAVPTWRFKKSDKTAQTAEPKVVSHPVLDMVKLEGGSFNAFYRSDNEKITVSPFYMGQFPVTYQKWKEVYFWALAKGYTFDRPGDMGSMYWFDYAHQPDEPVTNITWHDGLIWCNALSEMENKTPCYYEDEAKTKVYRHAFTWRALKIPGRELGPSPKLSGPYSKYRYMPYAEPWLFIRWDTDGYRLPTIAEWEYAARGGAPTRFFWGKNEVQGKDAPDFSKHAWGRENSGGTTHPVGQMPPNQFKLYDMIGNVYAMFWSKLYEPKPYDDTKDPEESRYEHLEKWRNSEAECSKRLPEYGGGSWFWDCFIPYDGMMQAAYSMPDVGLRVVRCDAGVHPRDGQPKVEKVYLAIDTKDYDPLEGQAFRGSLKRDGVYKTAGVAANPKEKWKFKTGGAVISSPVVVDGVVYFGSKDGNFYAVNAADGKQLWTVPVKAGVESSACVAPAPDDGKPAVYFCGNDGRLYVVDAKTGVVKYAAKINKWGKPIKSSPAVAYGVVFISDWNAVCFDVKNNKVIWRNNNAMSPQELGSLTLVGDRIFMTSAGSEYSYLLDIRTNVAKIVSPIYGYASTSTVAISEGTGYGATLENSPNIGAFDVTAEKPKGKWNRPVEGDLQVTERGKLQSSPAAWDGVVCVGCDSGCVYAFNAADGKPLWKFKTGGAIRSSPGISAADGIVYFGSNDGYLYAADAKSGAEKWKFKTGGAVISSPWVASGVVYVGSEDGNLYAIEGEKSFAEPSPR